MNLAESYFDHVNANGGSGPNGLAGQLLVYVIFPLIVATVLGIVALAISVARRLGMQDKALAILMQEVSPTGSPSLRDLLTSTRLEVATLKGALSGHAPPEGHRE